MNLQDLYAIATDHEADVLSDLQLRAGWLWKCPACSYNNESGTFDCEGCGFQLLDA